MSPVEAFPHGAPNAALAADGVVPAGQQLRTARERDGLSIEEVAQQLKLAPRQVRALEDGDFALLPGRTFVRGFVRNYARLLKLDIDQVIAALPGASVDPGLESPTLHATAPSIGELPVSQHARPGWIRWAIPLTLAIVAAVGVYEYLRPEDSTRPAPPSASGAREAVPESKPTAVAADAAATPASASETALPNPIAGVPLPNPVAPPVSATAASGQATTPNLAAAAGAAQPGERELVIAYRDHSWTEVRERNGRVLLSTMMAPGARQVLTGTPPFELVIGNAADVTLSFDGKVIDLVPHTRQSVARLTLP